MSEEIFRTVKGSATAQLEEKRSVFIAVAARVSDEEEAAAFLREQRRAHPDARHTVYAYLLRSGVARCSDDGEPQGTAGVPTLEAIRRAGLVDVCVATTRYFGGILLGTGGLTRAYAGAAHAALTAAGVAEYVPFAEFSITCTYAEHRKLQPELARLAVRERNVSYTDRVTLTVGIPAGEAETLCERVTEITAGNAEITRLSEGLDAV